MTFHKPGETCPKTAKYIEVDQFGNTNYVDNKDRIVSVEKDEQFPPTRDNNLYYKEY